MSEYSDDSVKKISFEFIDSNFDILNDFIKKHRDCGASESQIFRAIMSGYVSMISRFVCGSVGGKEKRHQLRDHIAEDVKLHIDKIIEIEEANGPSKKAENVH